jgi:glucose/arabinose dehydrogenase
MGPQGGDKLDLILRGHNYGSPVITYCREYNGELINGGLHEKEGMDQPLAYWVPLISGMGLYIVRHNAVPVEPDILGGGDRKAANRQQHDRAPRQAKRPRIVALSSCIYKDANRSKIRSYHDLRSSQRPNRPGL